jgi:hypothetical protein
MFSSLLGFVVVHKQLNLIKARARSVGSSPLALFNKARRAGVTSAPDNEKITNITDH